MKKYQTLLAYYSVITATILTLWSLIFAPRPEGFVMAVLILPMSIYFWLLVTGKLPHEEHDNAITSPTFPLGLMVAIALSISTASMLFYTARLGPQQEKNPDSAVTDSLTSIQSTISALNKRVAGLEKMTVTLDLIKSNLLKLEILGLPEPSLQPPSPTP